MKKKAKKVWMLNKPKPVRGKPTETEKANASNLFQPFIEKLKSELIKENPDKRYNFVVDIYSKWYRSFFYLCEKYKSESPNRISDEFEEKFVRLTFLGNNLYDFSYMRHTGAWVVVENGITLEECYDLATTNPAFRPYN